MELEKEGYGYVVASLGELGGVIPYTSYSARKSYLKEHKDTIERFTKAIQKGIDFVHNNDSKTIAKTILPQFADTSLNDLEEVITRYKNIDAWPKTTDFTEKSFNHMQDVMEQAGQLDTRVKYKDLAYEK